MARLLPLGHPRDAGQPRDVIDGDVEELLAGAALAALAGVVAGDAVADAIHTPELLGVEMDRLAEPLALVALDLARRVAGREPAEAAPAEHRFDGGERQPELAGDGAAGPVLPRRRLDLGLRRGRSPGRAAV